MGRRREVSGNGDQILRAQLKLQNLLPNCLHTPPESKIHLHVYLYLQWLKMGIRILEEQQGTGEDKLVDLITDGVYSSRERQKYTKQQQQQCISPVRCLRQIRPKIQQGGNVETNDTQHSGSTSGCRKTVRFGWKPVILSKGKKPSLETKPLCHQRPRAYKLHQATNPKVIQDQRYPPRSLSTGQVVHSEPELGSQGLPASQVAHSDPQQQQQQQPSPPVSHSIHSGPQGTHSTKINVRAKRVRSLKPSLDSHMLRTPSVLLSSVTSNTGETDGSLPEFRRLHDVYLEVTHSISQEDSSDSSFSCSVGDPMWCQTLLLSPQSKELERKAGKDCGNLLTPTNNVFKDGEIKLVAPTDDNMFQDVTAVDNVCQNEDSPLDVKDIMICESTSPLREVLEMSIFPASPPNTNHHHWSFEHCLSSPIGDVDCLDGNRRDDDMHMDLVSPWNTRRFIPWSPSHLFVRGKLPVYRNLVVNDWVRE